MEAGNDEFVLLCGNRSGLPREGVVLGLSGGRDSVALLRLLLLHGVPVFACHVHHGIRGTAADEDAKFCRVLCEKFGVPYAEYRVNVPQLARRNGNSLETEARLQRRRILEEHACKVGVRTIALAHHADDQAETALFNLSRGAAGALGMQVVYRGKDGITWWRPLLECRREKITAWLRELGQDWREDETNVSPNEATRNKLRLHILPELSKAMGRDVVPAIARSAGLQREVAGALEEALAALPIMDPQGRLYLPFLEGKGEAFRRAAVHFYLKLCGVPELSERCVAGVCSLLTPNAALHSYNLPGGFTAHRAHKRLFLRRNKILVKCTCVPRRDGRA